jgi:signal transduction histidine kinase/ActR/RegA family two-component response regulator
MADDYFPIAILQSLDLTLAQDVSYTAGADDILPESIGYTDFERRLHVFLRLKLLHERFAETYGRLTAARARLVKAERLSALGQMASGVAHDFNNVLSAILGRAEHLLRHQKADSPLAAELEVIRRAAADGAATIRRIQEFSRSISTLDSSVVAVADVVEDCLQLTRVRWKDEADKNGVKFNTRNEVDPQLETSANPAELREVFTNLLINALDAMPEGGEVTVRSRRIESDRRFMIEVIDTGAGMPPEVARRVFEPFFTTKQERGTGLGLSVVYGIITRLGGRIEVDGRPGRGACFKIWLNPPERKTESTPMRHVIAAPVEVTVRPAAQRLELLVVEDDRSVRELFVDVLREEGHLVMDAECGRRGIELARAHSFDAVITDLGMPDVTGWDVARSVKSRSPDTTVILISGWSDDFSQDHLISKGVDRWLSKPVSLDELFQVLRSVEPLEAKKSEESA